MEQAFNAPEQQTAPEMEEQVGMGIGYPELEEEDDEDNMEEIVANLEAHLNSMPEDQKAFFAEYGTTPEGAMLLGLLGGAEVYEYMSQYIDPSKTLKVVPAEGQAAPEGAATPAPEQGQSVAAQAPQGAPAQQPAQGVFQAQ